MKPATSLLLAAATLALALGFGLPVGPAESRAVPALALAAVPSLSPPVYR
ncbi:hypothetical protein G5B31_18580 [Rhodobacter sp. SGA-6-6]|nr:hypothetical protein [Rhodobacter sp. SGA-6-6]NGM47547.1 hypothetical protein [Rhodobacter sp. SGA-6-6]